MTGDCARLSLFGGFRLTQADGRVIPVNLRKAEALLAFLAVADRQTVSRELLASLLWGEFEDQRARQSLRQVLLALTKSLAGCEQPILHIDGQQVSIRPNALNVDAVAFEELVAESSFGSLSRAVALYRGEFLAGLRLDAPDFEDWVGATRSRLQDRAVQALLGLLDHQETAEDIAPAVATANQVLRIEPFREDVHRRLMGVYLRMGMRSSALTQYRACRDTLRRELGVEPDTRTMELYVGILAQTPCAAELEISEVEVEKTARSGANRNPAEIRGRLGDQASAFLDTACVIGLRSSCAVVAQAAGLADDEAAAALEELIAGTVVTVEGEDVLFRDSGDHEAFYESLVPPRRRQIHAKVAAAIRTLHGGLPEPHFQVLAHHLRQAGRLREALEAAFDAAGVETKRGELASARRILLDARAAVEALGDDGEALSVEVDIDLALGGQAGVIEDSEEALRFLKLAEGLAGRLGDAGRVAKSLVLQSRIHHRAGRLDMAHDTASRGLALAERGDCQAVWLPVETLLARLHLVGGEAQGASYRLERRIQRDTVLGLAADQAEATALLALLKAARGEFGEALRQCRAAVVLAETAGCGAALAACLEAQGLIQLWHGDHGAARDSLETALRSAEARGDLPRIYLLGGFRALALIAGGSEPEGIEALRETIAMARRLNTRFLLPMFKARLAEVTADGRAGHEAYRLAVAANDPWAGSVALRALAVASLHDRTVDPERAEQAIVAALATQESLGLAFEVRDSLAVQARALEAKGRAGDGPIEGLPASL